MYLRRLLSSRARPWYLMKFGFRQPVQEADCRRLAEYKGPFYGLFESEFGNRMIRAGLSASERLRSFEAARHLKVTTGSPLLLVERVFLYVGDGRVEVRRLSVPSGYHYRNTFEA